ncbi:hypothetical protein NL676_034680 [Syzygium grande]|nr:hypothetical protein NL676_034680 [Syzygium grande]
MSLLFPSTPISFPSPSMSMSSTVGRHVYASPPIVMFRRPGRPCNARSSTSRPSVHSFPSLSLSLSRGLGRRLCRCCSPPQAAASGRLPLHPPTRHPPPGRPPNTTPFPILATAPPLFALTAPIPAAAAGPARMPELLLLSTRPRPPLLPPRLLPPQPDLLAARLWPSLSPIARHHHGFYLTSPLSSLRFLTQIEGVADFVAGYG